MDLIEQVKSRLIEYDGTDVKRINHALKMHSYARFIAEGEGVADDIRETIEIAALMHNIGVHVAEEKYGSAAGKYQQLEGAAVAKELLSNIEIETATRERVEYLVAHHHAYSDITTLDYQILVEADFVVNVEEENLDRSAVKNLLVRVFRTETGAELLKTLYLDEKKK